MDNKMLISIMGTTAPSREGGSTSKDVDADAFSKALEQATAGRASGADHSETIIADKSTAKSEAARKEEAAEARQDRGAEAKLNDPKHLLGNRAYLYHLVYKNPDSLSMAEKQALKTGEFSRESVGLRDLQKMMADRGLLLRDLSFTQMADLTRRSSREQVSSFLDHLVREQRDELEGRSHRATAEAGMAAASSAETRRSADSSLDGTLSVASAQKAQESQKGDETAAARKRREVIDQIVQHMEIRNLAERDELHLKLNPEYLGELKIQLTHDSDGEISARFLTTSEDTREVLLEARSDLRQHVERRGLRMRDIEVELVEELA